MAITASGFYTKSLIDALDATGLGIDLTDNTNNKLSLITDSATPDFDDTTPYFSAGGTEFDNKASGVTDAALATQTLTASGGTITWDSNSGADWVQTSSTITNAMASVIYDDGETNDDLIILSDFTTAYSSVSGDFTVAWHANGIATLDVTP